jgi:LDH2 family malate/lactate/ureidoglycolate dehydrogenase
MASSQLRLTPKSARKLIFEALTGAGTHARNAGYFADAILDTELGGLEGHGFYWLQYYCEHVQSGKVDGRAVPLVKQLSPVAFRVDAGRGFAHPAIEKGFAKLIPAAKKNGIAGMAVHNSYNAATLGYHTGYLAKKRPGCLRLHQLDTRYSTCWRPQTGHRHQSAVLRGAGQEGQARLPDRPIRLGGHLDRGEACGR